jgi:PAS domain S-box-containing protein
MTSSLASNGTSVSTSDREQNGHEEHGLSSAAESRYRQLFEAIPEAAWVIDVETLRFLEVNDTALRRYGYTREEFLTLTALDIRPQEERSTFRALYQSLDPAQRHVGPLKHQRRDGSQIDVIVTSEQIELDGRAARLVIAVDVTEQQRLAEETRRQAARLQVLATASRTFGEAQHDINAVLDTVTRTISDVIGDGCVVRLMSTDGKWLRPVAHHHPVPELHQLHRKVHLEHRQGVNEGINGQVMRTGRPAFYPTINPKQQKIFRSPLWKPFEAFGVHSLIAVPLRARGRTFGTIFVFRDRTAESYTRSDLRMLEDLADRAALAIDSARLILGNRALEARFRAAVEGSTDAFTIFETVRDDASEIVDFAVSYANPESIRMFGCSRDEVIGRPISELYTDRYFSRFFERYREVAEERTTFIEEFSVDLPEAGRRWFWHQVVPLADGLAVTANDITARKCGEDAAR